MVGVSDRFDADGQSAGSAWPNSNPLHRPPLRKSVLTRQLWNLGASRLDYRTPQLFIYVVPVLGVAAEIVLAAAKRRVFEPLAMYFTISVWSAFLALVHGPTLRLPEKEPTLLTAL